MRKINLLVIHCSATRASLDVAATDIDRWHKARGWGGIGYHYFIRRSGEIEKGRPLEQVGAHVYGHNKQSIGICLAGGVDEAGKKGEDNFTQAQYASLRSLIGSLQELFPGIRVCGHRDLSSDIDGDGVIERFEWTKECPSFDVAAWCERNGIDA